MYCHILLLLIVTSATLISCSSESEQEVIATNVTSHLRLPIWLEGTYNGVHTGQDLIVSNQTVSFGYLSNFVEINAQDVISELENDHSYMITTSEYVVVFNKSSIQTEINLRLNELNLGWYRQVSKQ